MDIETLTGLMIRKILKPIVKIAIENGLKYKTFINILKEVYIEVCSDLSSRPNFSEISAKTGISRKHISDFIRDDNSDIKISSVGNYIKKVIDDWKNNFLDIDNVPIVLPYREQPNHEPSFTKIVKNNVVSITAHVLLNELLERNIVKKYDEDGVTYVEIIENNNLFENDEVKKYKSVGNNGADFLEILSEKLVCKNKNENKDKQIIEYGIDKNLVPQLQNDLEAEFNDFMLKSNKILTHYRDNSDSIEPQKITLGVYSLIKKI